MIVSKVLVPNRNKIFIASKFGSRTKDGGHRVSGKELKVFIKFYFFKSNYLNYNTIDQLYDKL